MAWSRCEWCGEKFKDGEIPVMAKILRPDRIVNKKFHERCYDRYLEVINEITIRRDDE